MWWRLGLLGTLDILALGGLLVSASAKMQVTLDLPPGAVAPPDPHVVQQGLELFGAVVGAVIVLALIGLNVLVLRWALRHRKAPDPA